MPLGHPGAGGTVDAWSARNTHHWTEWDLAGLLARKQASDPALAALLARKQASDPTLPDHPGTPTRVSLVVPARNEAATVGDVVTRVREALVDTVALLDEIVVIDSDSTDDTYAVATDAGAVVHRSAEIRPDLGSVPGKGEAMWKSQFVTTGDVLVFMDADLVDWDTHFVPGLLGPLLTRDDVALVKGFYERPGERAGSLDGGRVTELVARPWLALHRPELSGLVQPLAGEWAVRRSLFEQLSVPSGYAVELAALVDTAELLGADAIAQVDLGRRAHTHQDLLDLGAMATQILAAMDRRAMAPERHLVRAGLRTTLVPPIDQTDHAGDINQADQTDRNGQPGHAGAAAPVTLRQYRPGTGADGGSGVRLERTDRAVVVGERPPARTVAAVAS